jgi:hypothetical protein
MSKNKETARTDETKKPEAIEPADLDEVTGGVAGAAPGAAGGGLGMSWSGASGRALLQSGHHIAQ